MGKYKVYTDASVSMADGIMVAAYLICTNSDFITHKEKVMGGDKITEAETIAIGLALRYLLDNFELSKNDIIEVHTDSMYSKDILLGVQSANRSVNSSYIPGCPNFLLPRVNEAKETYEEAKEKCKVSILFTYGHSNQWNANVAVDRIARFKLAAVLNDLF